jgi:hypothetical protein
VLAFAVFGVGIRELLQLFLDSELSLKAVVAYFTDLWNLIDWFAIILFFWGFLVYHVESYVGPTGFRFLNDAFFAPHAPFIWKHHTGENLYCLSLFCMYLKMLRSFALFERLAIIVKIFLKMMVDVMYFSVVYLLLLFAFSIVMVGAGRPSGVLDKCHVELGNLFRGREDLSMQKEMSLNDTVCPGS